MERGTENQERGNEGSEKKREGGRERSGTCDEGERTRGEQSRIGSAAPIREISDGSLIYSDRNGSCTETLLGNYFTELEVAKKTHTSSIWHRGSWVVKIRPASTYN